MVAAGLVRSAWTSEPELPAQDGSAARVSASGPDEPMRPDPVGTEPTATEPEGPPLDLALVGSSIVSKTLGIRLPIPTDWERNANDRFSFYEQHPYGDRVNIEIDAVSMKPGRALRTMVTSRRRKLFEGELALERWSEVEEVRCDTHLAECYRKEFAFTDISGEPAHIPAVSFVYGLSLGESVLIVECWTREDMITVIRKTCGKLVRSVRVERQ